MLQRKQSLDVTGDASYRIQYHPLEGLIHFAYLPKEVDFPISPRPIISSTTLSETPNSKASGDTNASKVLPWRGNGNEGPSKRLKLK